MINLPELPPLSATLLDNIFINNIENNFDTAVVYSDISDHLPTVLNFEMQLIDSRPPSEYSMRLITPQEMESFKCTIANTD